MKTNDKQGSDAAQKSELVPQHKRIAMGVPLDGKGGTGQAKGEVKKTSK